MQTKHTPGPWRIQDSRSLPDFTIVPQWQKAVTRKNWDGDYYPLASVSKTFVRSTKGEKRPMFQHPELPEGQALANARLIAAAPELLEALGRISDSINGLSGLIPTRSNPEFWAYVKAIAAEAISKATGN